MKKIISLVLVAMMVVTMAVAVSADVTVNVAELPDAVDYSPAGYTQKVLQCGEKSIGTWDLSEVSKVVISYGTDHQEASIGNHKVYIKTAAGEVLGEAQLSQPFQFWAQGQRTVEVAIDTDYNGEVIITKDEANHMMAIDAITFVGEAEGGAPSTPSNPETGDFTVVIVAIAMIALAGVVVSKKVRA